MSGKVEAYVGDYYFKDIKSHAGFGINLGTPENPNSLVNFQESIDKIDPTQYKHFFNPEQLMKDLRNGETFDPYNGDHIRLHNMLKESKPELFNNLFKPAYLDVLAKTNEAATETNIVIFPDSEHLDFYRNNVGIIAPTLPSRNQFFTELAEGYTTSNMTELEPLVNNLPSDIRAEMISYASKDPKGFGHLLDLTWAATTISWDSSDYANSANPPEIGQDYRSLSGAIEGYIGNYYFDDIKNTQTLGINVGTPDNPESLAGFKQHIDNIDPTQWEHFFRAGQLLKDLQDGKPFNPYDPDHLRLFNMLKSKDPELFSKLFYPNYLKMSTYTVRNGGLIDPNHPDYFKSRPGFRVPENINQLFAQLKKAA